MEETMKRRLLMTVLPSVVLLATAAMASAEIRVYVDDNRVWFQGTAPHMMQNRVFVPLRGVFEQMGAEVMWDGPSQLVTARKGNKDIQLKIGSRTAWIDGVAHTMDVAPHIMKGSTMVPLRFISESLGADVRWDAGAEAVYITAVGTSTTTGTSGGSAVMLTLPESTVIPVRLDRELSSNKNIKGDPFSATINTKGAADYLGLPVGTKVYGEVLKATPRKGDDPGTLSLDFKRITLPDGRSMPIEAGLTGLDSKHVTNEDGRLVAKTEHRNDTLTYVGIGAGAGALVALLTDSGDLVRNGLIGAGLGWIYSEIQRNNQKPRDVVLTKDTEVGVRLDQRLIIR
jgi:hypothetical protein